MSVPARRDPQPYSRGWEAAFVAVSAVLLLLGVAAVAGVSTAGALTGHGWAWPHSRRATVAVLRGVLTGHPGQGTGLGSGQLPGPVLAYGCVAACELAMLAATAALVATGLRYHQPADARSGMATRAQAEQALGASTLRRARHQIRPDLYTVKRRRRPR